MPSNFPKKTNEWIEEEIDIPVMKPVVNEKKKRVEFVRGTEKATQKTFYADSPLKKIICKKHVYKCLDEGKYIFKCKNCDWNRIAYPVAHKFDPKTGILTNRKTGERV